MTREELMQIENSLVTANAAAAIVFQNQRNICRKLNIAGTESIFQEIDILISKSTDIITLELGKIDTDSEQLFSLDFKRDFKLFTA